MDMGNPVLPKSLRSLLLLSIIFVSFPAIADMAADKKAFRAAYREYQEADNAGQAVAAAKIAFETGRRIYGEQSQNTATLAYNYGLALVDNGSREDSRMILLEAVTLYEAFYGVGSEQLIPVLMDMGSASAELFNPKQQKKYYDRALRLASDLYGPKSDRYGQLLLRAGTGIMNESRSPVARKYVRDAYEILRNSLGDDDESTRTAAFQLALVDIGRSQYLKAEKYLLALMKTFDDPDRPSSQFEVGVHVALISVYQNRGDSDKAVTHCQAIGRMTAISDDHDYLPLFRRAPKYPMQALRRRKQGYAIIEFTVDREGAVRDPKAIKVHGHNAFEKASIEAVNAFRYAPRFVDGKPVATTNVRATITFKIE